MAAMMMTPTAVREAPRATVLAPATDDPAFPDVGDPTKPEFEEKLALDIIQGNIIDGGFNKDFQTALCLQIADAAHFKVWLKSQIDFISTAEEVLAFNRLFKKVHKKHGEPTRLKATWTNISFSFEGIRLLVGNTEANRFLDEPFKKDLAAQSKGLGDPTDAAAEGNPKNWVIGGTGPGNEPHVLMVVASDERADMLAEVARIEDTIFNFHVDGKHRSSGARIIFREEGANLPRPLAGHEHFGTLDGISQPGVRGRASDGHHDVITPRQNPEKVDDKGNRTQGKPGQDLLWPGEFVFGYPAQDPDAKTLDHSKGNMKKAVNTKGAHWTDNGSFLVFRRLRQDVVKFHRFLHSEAHTHRINPLLLSSKLVGRWESGAPTVRNPRRDDPTMGNDDCANNDFEFNSDPGILAPPAGPNDCADNFPVPAHPKDDATDAGSVEATGKRCPFTAHTRKAYPRNDLTPGGGTGGTRAERVDKSEVTTQTHRLMRRGIPFGAVSPSRPDEPIEDDVDRGLHFFAYQTSISNQFEFVTSKWVNNPDFSAEAAAGHECAGVLPLGHDPVIGQNGGSGSAGSRTRKFFVRFDEGGSNHCVQLTAPEDWVIPTGGGYFFTPSIDALKNTLTL